MGLLSGFAKINDLGVKVFEAGIDAPIPISVDKSWRPTVSKREQKAKGKRIQQQRAIAGAMEKVIAAINRADVSEQEKNKANSFFAKTTG